MKFTTYTIENNTNQDKKFLLSDEYIKKKIKQIEDNKIKAIKSIYQDGKDGM